MTQISSPLAGPRFAGRFHMEAPQLNQMNPADLQDLASGLVSDEFVKTQATISGLGDEQNPVLVRLNLHDSKFHADIKMPYGNKTRQVNKDKAETFTAFFKRLGETAQSFVETQLNEAKAAPAPVSLTIPTEETEMTRRKSSRRFSVDDFDTGFPVG